MEVVILAAGQSKRMGQDGSKHYPKKQFLDMGGEALISREVRILKKQGAPKVSIVGGSNYLQLRQILGPNVTYLNTPFNHSNPLYELAHVCNMTGERSELLVLLGDLVFSEAAALQFLTARGPPLIVFGSSSKEKYPGSWWSRGDEIFGVKLFGSKIKEAYSIFIDMKDLYYEWKNINIQLKLPIWPIPQCVDVDHGTDYGYALLKIGVHKPGA
jgi:choline kinase